MFSSCTDNWSFLSFLFSLVILLSCFPFLSSPLIMIIYLYQSFPSTNHFSPPIISQYCMITPTLTHLGLSALFGSFFVKMYRLDKIFNNPLLSLVVIKNTDLFAFLGGLLLVDAVILSAWGLLSHRHVKNDLERECVSDHDTLFWLITGEVTAEKDNTGNSSNRFVMSANY